MGSSPCRKIHLLGIGHPVVGKYFQALEIHRGMERIQDLSGEKKSRFGFVFYFLNFGWKTQSWLCKKNRGVIKLISIHFGYSSRFHVAFVIKRLLCVEIREY